VPQCTWVQPVWNGVKLLIVTSKNDEYDLTEDECQSDGPPIPREDDGDGGDNGGDDDGDDDDGGDNDDDDAVDSEDTYRCAKGTLEVHPVQKELYHADVCRTPGDPSWCTHTQNADVCGAIMDANPAGADWMCPVGCEFAPILEGQTVHGRGGQYTGAPFCYWAGTETECHRSTKPGASI